MTYFVSSGRKILLHQFVRDSDWDADSDGPKESCISLDTVEVTHQGKHTAMQPSHHHYCGHLLTHSCQKSNYLVHLVMCGQLLY